MCAPSFSEKNFLQNGTDERAQSPSEKVLLRLIEAIQDFHIKHPTSMTTGVGIRGRLVHIRAAPVQGTFREETLIPPALGRDRAQYPIASLTKQFTAAAVLRVLLDVWCKGEVGRLQEGLAQPLITFLKEDDAIWVGNPPPWAYHVTVHHLLSNTSGIFNYPSAPDYGDFRQQEGHTAADVAALFKEKACAFDPGTHYTYSNTNFFLAGLVVGRLSGDTLGAYMDRLFFTPLGMTDTFLPDARTAEAWRLITPRLVPGYSYSLQNSGAPLYRLQESDLERAEHCQGGGGLISSARDLVIWSHALYESEKILPAEVRDLMMTPGRPGSPYGYGLMIVDTVEQGPVYMHTGWIPGYLSTLYWIPSEGFTLLQLRNVAPHELQFLEVQRRKKAIDAATGRAKEALEAALQKEYPDHAAQREKYRLIEWSDIAAAFTPDVGMPPQPS